MGFNLILEETAWFEAFLVLVLGASGIVAGAAAGAGVSRSAGWQRAWWQAATAAVLALVFCELLGVGAALRGCWRAAGAATSARGATDGRHWEGRGGPWAAGGQRWAQGGGQRGVGGGQEALAVAPWWERSSSDRALKPPVQSAPKTTVPSEAQRDARLPSILGMLWMGGAVVLLGRTVVARFRLARFARRQRGVSDEDLCGTAAGLARQLGIRQVVRLVESPLLSVPAAFGVLRPTIALPAGFARQFDDRQRRAVLAHELAHLANRDSLWLLAADLAFAALWWHPLVWWAGRRLRAASETVADEASLLVPDGPDALAGCLVQMGRRLAGQRRLAWLSIGGPRFHSGLGRRVERLMNLPRGPQRAAGNGRMRPARIVLFVVFVLVSVFSTAWARPQAPLDQGETAMNVLHLSWRRSLAAAAVAAFFGPLSGHAMAGDEPKKDQPAPAVARDAPRADQPSADLDRGAKEDRERREARDVEQPRREPGQREGRPERRRAEAEDRRPEGPARRDAEPGDRAQRAERMESLIRERRELERHELEGMARELERQLRELGDTQKEKAEQLKRELDRIRQRMEQLLPPEGRETAQRFAWEGRFRGANAEAMRRLMHLRMAAENLRAAGMPEEAEKVMREAEKLQREQGLPPGRPGMMGPPEGRRPGPPGPPEGQQPGPPEGRRPGPPGPPEERRPEGPPPGGPGMGFGPGMPPGAPMPEMRELREQMDQMRRQMEELRAELRKLVEREEQRK